MKIGSLWKWKCGSERLVYIGTYRGWHQFEIEGQCGVVWCEVLPRDMHMLEEIVE